MSPDDVRAYAHRDWRATERSKRDYWAGELATRGPLATFEASQALWEHMRRVRPDWPSPEERCADLAHHLALRRALDLVAGVCRSTPLR